MTFRIECPSCGSEQDVRNEVGGSELEWPEDDGEYINQCFSCEKYFVVRSEKIPVLTAYEEECCECCNFRNIKLYNGRLYCKKHLDERTGGK